MVIHDFINNKPVSILHEDILYYYNFFNKTHKEYVSYLNHYKNIKDIAKVENLNLSDNFLYKDLPLSKKIISLYLNKNYDDLTLKELTDFWKIKIIEYCAKFESYIENEFKFSDNELYRSELLKIKESLELLKKFEELNKFKVKEELISYWPTILMPCPSFVEYSK